MMRSRKQELEGGDSSTNLQAGNDIYVGLSLDDARHVAMDVFKANFLELSNEALALAVKRAEALVTAFLEEVRKNGLSEIPEGKNPDFQSALFDAQKAYARTGDEDLGELLVQLLVDRSKVRNRDLEQIVLNESLEVASKLTPDQLDALALIFTFKYTRNPAVDSLDALRLYSEKSVVPFLDGASRSGAAYQHLEYAGCGSIAISPTVFHLMFTRPYGGLFSSGFSSEELEQQLASMTVNLTSDQRQELFITCLHDDQLMQVNAVNENDLVKSAEELGVPTDEITKLKQLYNSNLMRPDQVREKLVAIVPEMADFFRLWDDTPMASMSLTSVGIAIAHANIKRKTGANFPLSRWM